MKIKKIVFSNISVLTVLAALLLSGMLFQFRVLEFPERKIYDLLMRFQKAERTSRVVIVGLDEKTFRAGRVRASIAEAVQIISDAQAGAIGVSVLFPEKGPNLGLAEIQQLKEAVTSEKTPASGPENQIREGLFDEAIGRLDHDQQLISAVRSARNTVLPFKFIFQDAHPSAGPLDTLSGLLRINSVEFHHRFDRKNAFVFKAKDWFRRFRYPLPEPLYVRETYGELGGKAGALGQINLITDSDQIVRRIPLFLKYQGRWFPSFSLQLSAKANGLNIRDMPLYVSETGAGGLRFGETILPIDEDCQMFVRYLPDRLMMVPIKDLLNQKQDPALFKGRIVLIGDMSGDHGMFFKTPVMEKMPETAVLAHAVDTIVSGEFISRPTWVRVIEMGVMVFFWVCLIFIVPKVNLRLGGNILGFFLVVWVLTVVILFKTLGIWLWALPPIFLCVGGYLFVGGKIIAGHFKHQAFELYRIKGLNYQSQGLLDMAFEKFRKCPKDIHEVRQLLYDLGQEFERKRMFNKALAVYEYILSSGTYKDLLDRINKLRNGGAMVLNGKTKGLSPTLVLDAATAAPTFGRYEIIRELGQGAMGTVYLAKDPKIKREVAIKTLEYHAVLPEELEEVKSRFFHEAETAGKLSHPNIVTIYDIGEERDMAYMAMELLEGDDLYYFCRKENLLPQNRVLSIMKMVADALSYAHKNGVVHRDVKPSNIMLLENGVVKVTDFGIARAVDSTKTRTGIIMGTPAYMSPEQVAGKKVNGQSDLFSLGIVFYELLSGQRPFTGDDLTSLMYAITRSVYPPLSEMVPDLPSRCIQIIEKLMTKALTRRYKTAESVSRDIQKCLDSINV